MVTDHKYSSSLNLIFLTVLLFKAVKVHNNGHGWTVGVCKASWCVMKDKEETSMTQVLVHSTGRRIVNTEMKKIVGTAGFGLGSRED